MTDEPAAGGRLFGVLVTFRRPVELKAMLATLAGQARPPDHLLVVDNAPGEETAAIVQAHRTAGNEVTYLASPENLGPAGAVAVGMEEVLRRAGDADWVALIDDDDPPHHASLLADLVAFGERMRAADPRTGAVGLVGARFDARRGRLVRVPDDELDGPVAVDYFGTGQFPLYLTAAVRATGPFAAPLFFSFEDLEYGLRLRRGGWSMYACGPLWMERRVANRRVGLTVRPSYRLGGAPGWRRYYSLRNLVHLLRREGHPGAAVRVTARGVLKPVLNLPRHPRASARNLGLAVRAARDGWTGRLGRRVEPPADRGGG